MNTIVAYQISKPSQCNKKQWGKGRKKSALAIRTESIRAARRSGPSWISYRWNQVHSPFYTLQGNIYFRTYTTVCKLYSTISYLVCSVLCSRMEVSLLKLTLERLAWHPLTRRVSEWAPTKPKLLPQVVTVLWITYFQLHTHTHTHTLVLVLVLTTARTDYVAPILGVSQQEATRLVVLLAVETPAISPHLHGPLSALRYSFMGLQDPWDEGGGVRPWVMASEYLSSTLGRNTHTHAHTILLPLPTDEVEVLFGLLEVKAGTCWHGS